MIEKNQVKKMYEHIRLLEKAAIHPLELDYDMCEEDGLIEEGRDVKNIHEYHYLLSESQRSFQETKNSNSFWIEGYALDFTPIHSKENFHLFEFSLKNGDFLSFPFALEKGLDENYLKYLTAIHVKPLEKRVPAEVLVKKFGLLVTPQIINGEIAYYLHDISSLEKLKS